MYTYGANQMHLKFLKSRVALAATALLLGTITVAGAAPASASAVSASVDCSALTSGTDQFITMTPSDTVTVTFTGSCLSVEKNNPSYVTSLTISNGTNATAAAGVWTRSSVANWTVDVTGTPATTNDIGTGAFELKVKWGVGSWAYLQFVSSGLYTDATLNGFGAFQTSSASLYAKTPSFAPNTTSYSSSTTNQNSFVYAEPSLYQLGNNNLRATVVFKCGSTTLATAGFVSSSACSVSNGSTTTIQAIVTALDGTTTRTYNLALTNTTAALVITPPGGPSSPSTSQR